ncbi:hypothetical protein [Halomicronema sp. CCY15110]|nr:hypothetical protein [Halomicronema sp. CCY15110]
MLSRILSLILLVAMCKSGVNFKHFHLHTHQEHHRPPVVNAQRMRKLKRP